MRRTGSVARLVHVSCSLRSTTADTNMMSAATATSKPISAPPDIIRKKDSVYHCRERREKAQRAAKE